MQKQKAEEVLETLAALLLSYVDELFAYKDTPTTQFAFGERVAYTECLEYLQCWENARQIGLDFEIEKRYPLE